MAKFLRVFLVFLLLVLLAAAGAAVYVLRHSTDILITQLEKNLGVAVSAGDVAVHFPSTIEIQDLHVGDQLEAERLLITPSIAGFFLKKAVVFDRVWLTRPRVRLVRRADETLDVGLPQRPRPAEAPSPEGVPAGRPEEGRRPVPVIVEHLKIVDGRFTFIDEAVADPPFSFDIVDIQLETQRVSPLKPLRQKIDMEAQVGVSPGVASGRLTGKGEYDILSRQGTGRLDLTDVPLMLFEPYYVRYFGKPVRSGAGTLGSDVRVDGNDITLDGQISLSGVAFEEPSASGAPDKMTSWKDLGQAMLSRIFFPEGDTVIALSVTTHLDRPRFENVKIKGGSLGSGAVQAPVPPPFAAEGAGVSVEDLKKIGKEFEAVGKKFKEMFDF